MRRDGVFWFSCALLVAALAPSVVPLLDADPLYHWRWAYVDVPVALATFAAVSWGIWRLPSPTERLFWTLVAAAHAIALGQEVASAALYDRGSEPLVDVLFAVAWLGWYLVMGLAVWVGRNGGLREGAWRLGLVRALGLGVVAVGFLLYFESIPTRLDPDEPGPWSAGLFLYSALDILLCIAFFRSARRLEDPRWRSILHAIAWVLAVYAVVDTAEATLYVGSLVYWDPGPLWDIPWYAPEFAMVFVARRFLADARPSARPPVAGPEPRLDRGALIVGLLLLPLLHSGLHYAGLLDPALRAPREGLVAGYLVVMGAVTLLYLRSLERERRRGVRSLELSEQRYRSFVRIRSDAVYRAEAVPPIPVDTPRDDQLAAMEHRLIVEEAAAAGDATTDERVGALLGRPLAELLPEADRRALLSRWIDHGYRDDVEVVRPGDGPPARTLRIALTGIVSDGALTRAWATTSDVTAERLAAEENERLSLQLERARKMESLGTLAGGIAHDFNNLLVPIMGYTEFARSELRADQDGVRESLDKVMKASKVAADLVEQILAVSRDQPRAQVPFSPKETVETVLALLEPALPPGVRLEADVPDACPGCFGDPSRMHQVVMNLCTNAIQAIGDGRGRVRVRLRHEKGPAPGSGSTGWVVLEVDDDGPGIDPSIRERVFEPFFTTKTMERGTGLGLAVVHGIVLSHGGHIAVDSVPEEGTTVTVRIPAGVETLAPPEPERLGGTPRLRVLVLDDKPDVADVTAQMLEAEGHRVTVGADGPSALGILRAAGTPYDVVVTDYAMPTMDGLEFGREARRLCPGVGLVVSSGYHVDGLADLDPWVRLRKPFSRDQLARAVLDAARMPV